IINTSNSQANENDGRSNFKLSVPRDSEMQVLSSASERKLYQLKQDENRLKNVQNHLKMQLKRLEMENIALRRILTQEK
ncbi:MAG: hypothetical protein MHPSP_002815, partial [Paramarteilia canceri]